MTTHNDEGFQQSPLRRTFGCHVKVLGEWHRVEFDSEAVLDLAIKAFEAQGYEVS